MQYITIQPKYLYTQAEAEAECAQAQAHQDAIEADKRPIMDDVRSNIPEAVTAYGAYLEWRASSKNYGIAAFFNRAMARYQLVRDQYQPVGEVS